MGLFRFKQDAQGVGPAVAGDGAAGGGHMDLPEVHFLLHGFAHQLHIRGVDGGLGDKQVVPLDAGVLGKLVLHILGKHFFQGAPVFFPHVHGTVGVVHLDAGL